MKKIFLSIMLTLAEATAFASTQTKTTEDKPGQVYFFGGTMNTSDNISGVENDYYAQTISLDTIYTQIQSGNSVAWLNGLGGAGAGTVLNHTVTEDYYGSYTNYDNSLENDSINLDWSGFGAVYQSDSYWGSHSGNSYSYTSQRPIYATISGYVGNEHCDVTDSARPPFWIGAEYTYDLGSVLEEVTTVETYQRYAQAAWHVHTGGKAIPGRQSLWQFSGYAQNVTNKRAGPPYNADNTQSITNLNSIALGSIGNLQSDGTLWRTFPDNSDIDITPAISGNDFYQFYVGGQKYSLEIFATTNGTPVDLSANTPEFCVGQNVSFALNWAPEFPDLFPSTGGNPPPFTNAIYHWNLPQKYVNEVYQPYEFFSPAPTVYDVNPDLFVNTNQISCWYVNGQGSQISVGLNLEFNDGQYASIAAIGSFTIYRPTFSHFNKSQNGFSWSSPELLGVMAWGVQLNSKYDGLFGETQILNSGNENSDYYTGGNDYLDGNSEIYGTQNTNGPSQYKAADSSTHSISFIDNPTDLASPCANMFANFKDYLRFQPAGANSIYVTISTNGWYMNGAACLIGVIAPNDLPPATAQVNDDTFPGWVNVRHGGGN